MRVKLPNFLVVGAGKSGTTSIFHYLKQHPDIYVPENKEPRFFVSSKFEQFNPKDPLYNYFNKSISFSIENYSKLFNKVTHESAIGEASVQYLYYYDTAIPQIKKFLGDIKIIMILRNPVERAFSAYVHLLRDGFESLPFEKCLEIEEEKIKANWDTLHFCKNAGFYYKQVKAYLENFNHVKVYLYDDLEKEPLHLVSDLCQFLGVDPSFVPNNVKVKFNISGIPQVKSLQSFLVKYDHPLKRPLRPLFLNTIGRKNTEILVNYFRKKNLRKPKIKPETKKYLIDLYKEDILLLQELINRDLSSWLK